MAHIPKGIEVIHFFKGRLYGADAGRVFFGRPPGIPLKNSGEHLEEVFFAFPLGGHVVIKRGIHAVEGSPSQRVRQGFDRWRASTITVGT